MDHCVSSFLKIQREKAYKIYVTDCLYSVVNMYSVSHGGEQAISKRFAEIIEPKKKEKEETAEEIIARMRNKAKRMN